MKDLRLSVSKTKTFIDCKAKFNFSYNLKLPKKEMDYHIFGKFCHKALEDFHLAYIDGSTLPYNKVMGWAYKNALTEFKEKMTEDQKSQAKIIIDKYLQIVYKEKFNVIAVEKKFDFKIAENIILNGMIDRIQIDDDNVLHVADYKTTQNLKYLKNDWFQLLTYALVLLEEDPSITKIRASYILLKHDFQYITKEFSLPEIMEVKDKYIEYANQINSETEYPANITNLCPWCEFKESCVPFQEKNKDRYKFGAVDY